MAAFVELHVVGGSLAYIEAGAITGLITAPGHHLFDVANKEKPITLILRGGETFKVIGESAGKILARCAQVRKRLRDDGGEILIDYLEPNGNADEDPSEKVQTQVG